MSKNNPSSRIDYATVSLKKNTMSDYSDDKPATDTIDVTVTAAYLNVRSSPSIDSDVIRILKRGDVIKCQYLDNWSITEDGYYIMSKYLSPTK